MIQYNDAFVSKMESKCLLAAILKANKGTLTFYITQTSIMKKFQIPLSILSVLLIVMGFGMIHSVKGNLEIVSILMIGTGTFYLLFLLLSNSKNQKES